MTRCSLAAATLGSEIHLAKPKNITLDVGPLNGEASCEVLLRIFPPQPLQMLLVKRPHLGGWLEDINDSMKKRVMLYINNLWAFPNIRPA